MLFYITPIWNYNPSKAKTRAVRPYAETFQRQFPLKNLFFIQKYLWQISPGCRKVINPPNPADPPSPTKSRPTSPPGRQPTGQRPYKPPFNRRLWSQRKRRKRSGYRRCLHRPVENHCFSPLFFMVEFFRGISCLVFFNVFFYFDEKKTENTNLFFIYFKF